MAHKTLLSYPDFNNQFVINMDARNLLLGAVIIQKGRTIEFYISKLTDPQTSYTVMGKGTTENCRNSEVISHYFIRSTIKYIY